MPRQPWSRRATPDIVSRSLSVKLSRFIALYRRHFRDHRRERMFLASSSFFVIFGATRILVYGFAARGDPLQLWIAGVRVHHYVWGIALLLLVGYLWLIQVGTGMSRESHRLGRITALLYGGGAALTLDEFAMWLHLEDVYWERASLDAVVLFGALVSAGLWGGPFWRGLLRQGTRLLRRDRRAPAPVRAPGAPSPAGPIELILAPPIPGPERS